MATVRVPELYAGASVTAGAQRVTLLLTSPGWRGSGISFAKIADGLASRGHAVHLIAGEESVAAAFEGAGRSVALVPTGDTGRREVGTVRRLLAVHRSTVVLCDAPRDVRIARYASLGRRRRILWRYNLHGRRLATDLLQRWLFGGVDAIAHLSQHGQRKLQLESPWLRRPEVVIPNGFDIARFVPESSAAARWRSQRGLGDGAALVLTPTGWSAEKSAEVAAAAMERVATRRDVTWAHLGDRGGGPARAIGLGRLPQGELHAAMQAADVILLPGSQELFGNVTAEAMAFGRPVVATAGGATPEVVGDAGVLVAPGDAALMAAAVEELLDDPARAAALGRRARERVAERFTLERMVDGFDRLVRTMP